MKGKDLEHVGTITGRITSKQNLRYKEAKAKALTSHVLDMHNFEDKQWIKEVKKLMKNFPMEFFVAGVKFRKDWRENIKALEEGEILKLVPEPTNKFDKNAIQITSSKDVMLGYVPAKTGEALIVSSALKREMTLKATLIELAPDFEPWTALQVKIEEVDMTVVGLCPFTLNSGLKDQGCVYLIGRITNGICQNLDICPGNGDAWCFEEEVT